MKGVLFNVVEEVVTAAWSPEMWDEALDHAGASGSYTSLGNYPAGELVGIIGAVSALSGLSVPEVVVAAGRAGYGRLVVRAPDLVGQFGSWQDLLAHLDDVIHPEVLKVYPDASVPKFRVVERDASSLLLDYESALRLCRLAEGLVLGAGDWYGTALSVTHESCVLDGGAACHLRIRETC